MPTKIPWTDETWNFLGGCTSVSEGCLHCAAAASAQLCVNRGNKKYEGLVKNGKWTGEVRLFPNELDKPLHWRKSRMIFPAFMGDLFHEKVPFEFRADVLSVLAVCRHHTGQILTKRPSEMLKTFTDPRLRKHIAKRVLEWDLGYAVINPETDAGWPLPNVWLGVTAENQRCADERIPILLQIPVAVRFVSLEPMLGEIDLRKYFIAREMECKKCGHKFWSYDAEFCGGHRLYDCGCRSMGDPTCTCVEDNRETLQCPKCYECACDKREKWTKEKRITPTKGQYDWVLDIDKWQKLHQVIIGCESINGRAGRFCEEEAKWWDAAHSLVDQGKAAGVPIFFKQGPLNGKVSRDPNNWPEWARLQEYPK